MSTVGFLPLSDGSVESQDFRQEVRKVRIGKYEVFLASRIQQKTWQWLLIGERMGALNEKEDG